MASRNRLIRELRDIHSHPDHSIYIHYNDDDVYNITAFLVGPANTPYQYGMFEFRMQFGNDYPLHPPKVCAMTTNGGQTRFNPNMYANGKVCLSILGTWAGEPWTSALGVLTCLTSIWSLFSENPIRNEPGREGLKAGDPKSEAYNQKIQHETIRISILDRLEGYLKNSDKELKLPESLFDSCTQYIHIESEDEDEDEDEENEEDLDESEVVETNASGIPLQLGPGAVIKLPVGKSVPSTSSSGTFPLPNESRQALKASSKQMISHTVEFSDLSKRLFLMYYDLYIATCEGADPDLKGKRFVCTDFEHSGNIMNGTYDYNNLGERLRKVKTALDEEVQVGWLQQHREAIAQGSSASVRVRRQFEQCAEYYRSSHQSIELALEVETNPFVWLVTFFGNASSSLDGGLVQSRFIISIRFPEIQPRITVLTALFHPNINTNGTPYLLGSPDSMREQIDRFASFLHRDPESNPAARINIEASQLCWGNKAERLLYRRKFRRCVQDSIEGS